jgi:hypothetical protein
LAKYAARWGGGFGWAITAFCVEFLTSVTPTSLLGKTLSRY